MRNERAIDADPAGDSQESIEALRHENTLLRRRLDRERRIRHQAEDIAEQGLRDLYQRQQELEFLSAITVMANEAGSVGEALAPVLEFMCRFTGWPAAHAHLLGGDGDARAMRASNIWYVDPALDLAELRTETAVLPFAKGDGLPGQVWESGEAVWLDDLTTCANFPRREAALRSGIRAAFSAPLLTGSEVAGTLEFFGTNPMPRDPDLLGLVAKAGTQLGRVIERANAAAGLAHALADSQRVSALMRVKTDAMMDPQAMIAPVRDSHGRIVDFRCLDANLAAAQDRGMTREELLGRRQREVFPDAAHSVLIAHLERCIDEGQPVILDETPYGRDLPSGTRYYDVRAVRVGSDTINVTWRDVTDRCALTRKLSRALQDSERANVLLRANTDALSDPQVLFEGVRDSSGRIVDLVYRDVNVATCQYLGVSRTELLGHSCLETLPNIEGSGLLAHYILCAETGQAVVLDEFPYYNELLDDKRYYDIRAAFAGYDSISLTWRDVTDRVRTAQRIAASEEHFRLLAENAGDVVMHVRDDRIVWISPSVEKVLNAPPQYWLGRRTAEMIPPEDRGIHPDRVQKIREGPYIGQARVIDVDGTPHWVHVYAKPFYDAHGRRDGAVSAFRVIDDEVAARQETTRALLRHARADERYRKLMNNSAVGMSLLDPTSGRYEVVNQALCDFFGYDAEAMLGKTWQELTAAAYLEPDLEKIDDLLAGRLDSYRVTEQYIHADGHLIWGDLTMSCIRTPAGQVENLIAQIIDVTGQMEARSRIAQREDQNRVLAQRLQAQTDRLMSEIRSAARYVASILPGELDGPVKVSSRYLPSRELSGDCFDYSWIDDDHLIFYLIDVSGHGIEPSLVSISVHNLLRSKSLPASTLLKPDRVLAELNELFDMDRHGGNYFTLWYGVYQASSRTLRYSSAGHPPALAFTAGQNTVTMTRLATPALPVGMFDDTEFPCATYSVPPGSQILLYSDGVFELPLAVGNRWSLADFTALCTALAASPDWSLDALISELRTRTAGGLFDDDCSLVRLTFP